MIIRVDIDNTICTTNDVDYVLAQPIKHMIDWINGLYTDGHTIIYWTARGAVTGLDWKGLTEHQLKEWGCLYHSLEMGKPHYDLMICDKTINPRGMDDDYRTIMGV